MFNVEKFAKDNFVDISCAIGDSNLCTSDGPPLSFVLRNYFEDQLSYDQIEELADFVYEEMPNGYFA